MDTEQNIIERLSDKLERGEITADQANVMKVLAKRVQLVTFRMPAPVRKALNAAVKRGELGHMKKEGHKPEAYFHPTFDYLARAERNKHERETLNSIASVFGWKQKV